MNVTSTTIDTLYARNSKTIDANRGETRVGVMWGGAKGLNGGATMSNKDNDEEASWYGDDDATIYAITRER